LVLGGQYSRADGRPTPTHSANAERTTAARGGALRTARLASDAHRAHLHSTFPPRRQCWRWAEGKSKAYIYTRYGNPTLAVAQEKIRRARGAEAAVVTASGMAAISSALLGALKCGDELISTAQLYGARIA